MVEVVAVGVVCRNIMHQRWNNQFEHPQAFNQPPGNYGFTAEKYGKDTLYVRIWNNTIR